MLGVVLAVVFGVSCGVTFCTSAAKTRGAHPLERQTHLALAARVQRLQPPHTRVIEERVERVDCDHLLDKCWKSESLKFNNELREY